MNLYWTRVRIPPAPLNMKKETVKREGILASIVSDSERYSSEKGLISMVGPCAATMGTYEIYCLKGNLFDDIERYDTLEEAETRICELLS